MFDSFKRFYSQISQYTMKLYIITVMFRWKIARAKSLWLNELIQELDKIGMPSLIETKNLVEPRFKQSAANHCEKLYEERPKKSKALGHAEDPRRMGGSSCAYTYCNTAKSIYIYIIYI